MQRRAHRGLALRKETRREQRDRPDPRLVVGISRSRASWWGALAWAVGEARRRGARLLLVNVFRPPVAPPSADTGYGAARDPYARAACGAVTR